MHCHAIFLVLFASACIMQGSNSFPNYQWRSSIESIFNIMDTNGDGILTVKEFMDNGSGSENDWYMNMIIIGDKDGDGALNLQEFLALHV